MILKLLVRGPQFEKRCSLPSVLNLGCTLESPGEPLEHGIPGLHPRPREPMGGEGCWHPCFSNGSQVVLMQRLDHCSTPSPSPGLQSLPPSILLPPHILRKASSLSLHSQTSGAATPGFSPSSPSTVTPQPTHPVTCSLNPTDNCQPSPC